MMTKSHKILVAMPRFKMSTLTQNKKSQLHQSVDDERPFYISVEGYEVNQTLGVTFYTIEIGFKCDDDAVESYTTLKRFSQLEKLDRIIRTKINPQGIAKFPPKRLFFNTRPDFIQKRAKDLQAYLQSLTMVKGITKLTEFKVFFGI